MSSAVMVWPPHRPTNAYEFSRRMPLPYTTIRKFMHIPKTKASLMYRSGNLTRLHGSTQLLSSHSAFVFSGLSRHLFVICHYSTIASVSELLKEPTRKRHYKSASTKDKAICDMRPSFLLSQGRKPYGGGVSTVSDARRD